MTKFHLRKDIQEIRQKYWQSLSPGAQEDVAQNLSTHVFHYLQSLPFHQPMVGVYSAQKNEAPTFYLIEALSQKGYALCLPKIVQQGEMDFYRYHPGDALTANAYGILEPSDNALCVPQVLVIPGLAFTPQGHRLGYGKGYYDRYLEKQGVLDVLPFKIGYGFDCQIIQEIPILPHDQIMDCVITQSQVLISPKMNNYS